MSPYEMHKLLWEMGQRQQRILSAVNANGRKLDLLLKNSVDEKAIAALTAELSADDAKLQASIDAAKAAAPAKT